MTIGSAVIAPLVLLGMISAALADDPAPAPEHDTGVWFADEAVSQLDDVKTLMISVTADHPVTSRTGQPILPVLVITCREGRTALFVELSGLFVADVDDYGRVATRMDKDRPSSVVMGATPDNSALGLWSSDESVPFIKEMFGKKTVLMRVTPFRETAVDVRFNVAGIENASRPIAAACAWP